MKSLENGLNYQDLQTQLRQKRHKQFWTLLVVGGSYLVLSWLLHFSNTIGIWAIPKSFSWLFINFVPHAQTMQTLPDILSKLLATIGLAISSAFIAAIFAIGLVSFCAPVMPHYRGVKRIVRLIASFLRNIPLVAWSMLLLFTFKQNDLTGFLALFLMSLGFLLRAFLEIMEDESSQIAEALQVTGAGGLVILCRGVLPTVMPQFVSWILYMIENNIRDATLVGILTGTGIGFVFDSYFKSLRYDLAGITVLCIIVVVITLENISAQLRRVIA
ncbi:ABC transporter permease subunit [Agrilactobacillus fermenti]|uniref:ABC transporter permease subunit n=1 Tax=Agrilactobacillus fermenti TaxID=2586909 RepID=UPI003A5C77DF